jgi:hypothetical protein
LNLSHLASKAAKNKTPRGRGFGFKIHILLSIKLSIHSYLTSIVI